jgi:hypothetical protein
LAVCTPNPGESGTCVQHVELNPVRLSHIKVSRQSFPYMRQLLQNADLFPEIESLRIAVEQVSRLLETFDGVLFRYDVPIGSESRNSDCQIYDLGDATALEEFLLYQADCTLALEMILQYTSIVADIEEHRREAGLDMGLLTDDELLNLYASVRYFNTAVAYSFHGLRGPVDTAGRLIGSNFAKMGDWKSSAWPWGMSESGTFFPGGGIVEYHTQEDDTWGSIAQAFTGTDFAVELIKLNPEYQIGKPLESGEDVYVPLEVADWVELAIDGRNATELAEEVYGEGALGEMISRICNIEGEQASDKCVVPVFYDNRQVHDAFFQN